MGDTPNGISECFDSVTSDFINGYPGRDSIRFFNLPMPPSSNHQYSLFQRAGKIRHISSRSLVAYKREMETYPFQFPNTTLFARALMAKWVASQTPLEFHAVFFFPKKKLFTREGRLKKLDVSNRVKALHDCVSQLLLCDDSLYFRTLEEKAMTGLEQEMVSIEILPFR